MPSLREAATQALEALEIGYDSAQAEAHQFHAAMAGYKPQRHAAMDADVQKIARAITALRAALVEDAMQKFTDVNQELEAALAEDVVTHGSAWSKDGKRIDPTSVYAEPVQEPALQTCNCRWDGEVQVQQCTLHEAHIDAIHEWAGRAKVAEKKLAALAEPPPHQFPLQSDRMRIDPVTGNVSIGTAPPQRKPRHVSYVCPQCHWSLDERNPLTDEDGGVCRHCDGSGCVACDARCLPEQPVQEPVGEVEAIDEDKEEGTCHAIVALYNPVNLGDRLHTAPPQRKPLSEEEIQAAWDSVDMRHPRGNETRIAFARAIERAHGIGENT